MKNFLLAVLFFAAFVTVRGAFAQDYMVGEEDVLKINVYDNPDLTATVRVSGDGVIAFPLIGNLKAAGLTTQQIAQKIASLLADGYVVDPHVEVFVIEYKSKKTTILGHVEKPGIYVLSGSTTFLELLSKAGGLSKDAGDKAILNRKAGASGRNDNIIPIDLKRLVVDGDTSLDIPVMDGDNIFIPKAGVFYITGEVKKPDAYKREEGTTLIKAVTTAGGFTDKASKGRIRIIRKSGGKEQIIEKADMDETVLPNDIIVVPESLF